MPSTTTLTKTLLMALDGALPGEFASAAERAKLGTRDTILKRAFTITASATADLTALDAAGETAGALNPNRLPIKHCRSLRITASGTGASLGAYILTDSGGTAIVPPGGASAAVGVALISDDGKTITFPNTVTQFTVEYTPGGRSDGGAFTPWPEALGNAY